MFNLLGNVIGAVSGFVEKDQAIKEIKEKSKRNIAQAQADLALAKLTAKTQSAKRQSENDHNYDMQVLKNRKETVMDEVIILGFVIILILTFIPSMQDTMKQGWDALMDTPWWFEFGIVGILVSTLGLKDVLRIFMGGSIQKLKKKQQIQK
tara:strand:- start:144 stop:596 length:453 start_codon:yes stop_codon:yes gene_type:complete